MPPVHRAPRANQRADAHQAHPGSQFCHHTALRRLPRPREDVGEGAEQPAILQSLHVGDDHVAASRAAASFQASGAGLPIIRPRGKMGHLLQNVDHHFEENQPGSARLVPGSVQNTFGAALWAADLRDCRNASNRRLGGLHRRCRHLQCQ